MRAICAHCRGTCPTPIRAWPVSTDSAPPGSCGGFEVPITSCGKVLPSVRWLARIGPFAMVRGIGRAPFERTEESGSMSRGLIADRAKLSLFVARRALLVGYARLNAHPLVRWRFASTGTDRLLISPQDLRTADPTRASEIYAGRFAFAGKVVICDGRSPFEMQPPSEEWAEGLFGFGWLRHLRAAESGIARANARALVDEWISMQSFDPTAWRPDIV